MDAVKGVDGGNAEDAGGHPSVEARSLAVGVDDVDRVPADEAGGQRQVAHAEAAQRQLLHERHPQLLQALEEDAVSRRRHHHLELVARQMAHQVEDVLGPASGAGGDQEVEDPDRARHDGACSDRRGDGPAPRRGRISHIVSVRSPNR